MIAGAYFSPLFITYVIFFSLERFNAFIHPNVLTCGWMFEAQARRRKTSRFIRAIIYIVVKWEGVMSVHRRRDKKKVFLIVPFISEF